MSETYEAENSWYFCLFLVRAKTFPKVKKGEVGGNDNGEASAGKCLYPVNVVSNYLV